MSLVPRQSIFSCRSTDHALTRRSSSPSAACMSWLYSPRWLPVVISQAGCQSLYPKLVASRYIPSWLPVDSVSDELESPQPSTSTVTTPTSATKRKFSYRQGLPLRERMSAAERRRQPVETSFVRCCMMSTLVKGLLCLECSAPTLKIRAIDRRLGLMCLYETYCTTCGVVLNSTLSSDRTDKERAGNVPFVVVGHAGLVKLCRFMAEASTKTA